MKKELALATGWIDGHYGSCDCGADLAHHGKHMILHVKQHTAQIGLSRSTIYNRIKDGSLPDPFSLGGKSVGWFVSDIGAYLEQCAQTRRGGVQ